MDDKQIIIAFGHALKAAREEKGISQETLAFNIQSHPTHISRLENGHKQPTLTTLFKIADQLDVELEDLLRQVKPKKTK